MTKEQLISRESKKLRIRHLTDGLTELECQDFIEMVVTKALTIHSVVVPKGTLVCDCLTPELLGRYTELKDVCKCGKTVAK